MFKCMGNSFLSGALMTLSSILCLSVFDIIIQGKSVGKCYMLHHMIGHMMSV